MDSHPAAQRPSPGHQPWRGLGEPLSLHRGLRRWPHLLTPSDSEGPVPVRASLVSGDGHPLGSTLSPLGRSRRPTDTLPSWLSSVISAFRPLTAGQRPQATRETSATHPLAQIPTEALGPSLQAYPEGSGWFSWHRGPPHLRPGSCPGSRLEAQIRVQAAYQGGDPEKTAQGRQEPRRGEEGRNKSRGGPVIPRHRPPSGGAGGAPRRGARCVSTRTLSLAEGHSWTLMLRLPCRWARPGERGSGWPPAWLVPGRGTQKASGLGVRSRGADRALWSASHSSPGSR